MRKAEAGTGLRLPRWVRNEAEVKIGASSSREPASNVCARILGESVTLDHIISVGWDLWVWGSMEDELVHAMNTRRAA